jgi:hypothetical protein
VPPCFKLLLIAEACIGWQAGCPLPFRRKTMEAIPANRSDVQPKMPWNKGKLTGAKPALKIKHVWSIRSQLHAEGRIRELAMFNVAIDS